MLFLLPTKISIHVSGGVTHATSHSDLRDLSDFAISPAPCLLGERRFLVSNSSCYTLSVARPVMCSPAVPPIRPHMDPGFVEIGPCWTHGVKQTVYKPLAVFQPTKQPFLTVAMTGLPPACPGCQGSALSPSAQPPTCHKKSPFNLETSPSAAPRCGSRASPLRSPLPAISAAE